MCEIGARFVTGLRINELAGALWLLEEANSKPLSEY